VAKAPFYRPAPDSAEMKYVQERRAALNGPVPRRQVKVAPIVGEFGDAFEEFHKGTEGRKASTTMVFVKMLSKLLKDETIGKFVVPIVPDEARTFGMEALFRQVGIYAHAGQLYEPVDRDTLLYYKEAEDGQILEEGINEAGSMSSFIAAGTAYATHGINMIPFFIFYSMFGFQRVGDLIWAGADMRMKGFVLGGTAGRTTLNGEGLQHEDGQSHVLAMPVPNCQSYDPAFAYELAVIIEDGIKRMYRDQEDIFYYMTLMNENYEHPPMPEGSKDGIIKGMYVCKPTSKPKAKLRAQLFGSGTILLQALEAQKILEEKYDIGADVWSVTSYVNLYRDGNACERWNRLHPMEKPKVPYVTQVTKDAPGVFVSASDYLKVLPDSIDRWMPKTLHALGTDGFGRSDSRAALRNFFEVDARFIVLSTLYGLMQEKQVAPELVAKAIKDLGIDSEKLNPAIS
jgi:pyruvate dehydrogenase E1 component